MWFDSTARLTTPLASDRIPTMMIEVDRDLAVILRETINEAIYSGRFDEDDVDRLIDLRRQLVAFITTKESA